MNWWYTSKNSPDMWQYGQDECYFLTKGRKRVRKRRERQVSMSADSASVKHQKREVFCLNDWSLFLSVQISLVLPFYPRQDFINVSLTCRCLRVRLILFMCRHVYLSVVCIFWADMDSFGNLMVSSWYSSWFQWCVLHCDSPACVKINLTALHHISQQFFVMSVLGGQPGAQLIALSVKPDRRH